LSIVAIFQVDICKITEIIEAWLADPANNVIHPGSEGVGFAVRGRWLVRAGCCPAGAISEAGHDTVKCKQYIREVTAVHVSQHQLGFKVNSCGLCQTKVVCEAGKPLRTEKRG
jgi:hypothetical protein